MAELKRIKRLARNVLRQRSEVEQFLVDSISHVKAQIQRTREAFLKVRGPTFLLVLPYAASTHP